MAFKVISQKRYAENELQFVYGVTDANNYSAAFAEISNYVVTTCGSSLDNIDNMTFTRLKSLQDDQSYGNCVGYQVAIFFALPPS